MTKWFATRSVHTFVILIITGCFVAWGSLFIYRSSVIGIDGRLYFALFDDAMISMRYAWNLSHGFGLVYNPGEYVEGYTNPLMTLVMSLATSLFDKVNAVLAIQVLGVILTLANAYLVMLIAGRILSRANEQHRDLVRVLAFLCALSYYPLLYWSLMGMETGLLAVLLSLSVLSALGYARDRKPTQGLLLSASLGLAFLTRMDAVIFAVPVFAYAFFGGRKRITPTHLLALLGPFALIVVGQEAFRWGYYGELLPNTYTLKMTGMPLLFRIKNGADFVAPFLTEVWVLLVLVGAALLFDFRGSKLFLVSIFAALLCYQVWIGGDAWNLWRILSPAMPIMLVLGAQEILRVVAAVSDTAGFRRYFASNPIIPSRHAPRFVSVLAVLTVLFLVNFRFLPEITMRQQSEEEAFEEGRVNAALAISRFTTRDASVGMFAAGTVPYYSGRPAIDFLGKSDRYVAQLAPDLSNTRPGHNKHDLEYSIKELKPTYAEGFQWSKQSVLDWAKYEYITVNYEGMSLNLLKGSEEVRWDEVFEAVLAGEATLEDPK